MSAPSREPSLAALPNPLLRYFLATRPAFLTITLVGCVLGLATAYHDGMVLRAPLALVSTVFALVAHAGINVLNDYYDALNGTDAINVQRLYPYTGGSRFIQNGVLTPRATAVFGFLLLAAVIPAGLWLARHSAGGLVAIGAAGLFIGWAYSAEPLRLNARGLGEVCVAAGFALVVVGTDFVQRGSFGLLPWAVALPYGLLVTAILYVNQFPDRAADAVAGKHHWVVRLPPRRAAWGYGLILLSAYGSLAMAIALQVLPPAAVAAAAALPLNLTAFRDLLRHAETPRRLTPAIRATLAAAHVAGLLLAGVLALNGGTR